jgi:hypothetical protein
MWLSLLQLAKTKKCDPPLELYNDGSLFLSRAYKLKVFVCAFVDLFDTTEGV